MNKLNDYIIQISSTSPVYSSTGVSLSSVLNDRNQQILEQVESKKYIEKEIERSKRYIPNIDFRDPESFVKYGSAEKYYTDSIERIYKRYPYDGSRAEVLEWKNEASYLDLYMFDKLYPKNIGYVSLNSWMQSYNTGSTVTADLFQSINFNGYPNADDTYVNPYHVIEAEDSQANIVDNKRGSNMKYDPAKGLSIEYWAKVDSREILESMVGNGAEGISIDIPVQIANLYTSGLERNILFSFGVNYRVDRTKISSESEEYNDIRKWYLYFDIQRFKEPSSPEDALYVPESYFASDQPTRSIIELPNPEEWAHYAVSVDEDLTRIYFNGTLVAGLLYKTITETEPHHISELELPVLYGNIGSTIAPEPNDEASENPGEMYIVGPVGVSVDEFRVWNSTRKESQIKRHFWDQVGGGTNTDDANIDLGVYYKFNEGIYGTNAYDENVLDYSGRQTDSTILNYTPQVRHTSSSPLPSEEGDPVIYSGHPSVVSLQQQYEKIGRYYDQKNNSKMYNMIPGWIIEEEQETDSEVLKNMIQIMSSYLDTLYLQIEKLPEVVGAKQEYLHDTEKAENTTRHMLANKGFIVPELFADSTLLEKFQHRGDKEKFEKELSVVKNLIYRNILNNSTNILKSKGTEKSLRNLMRCFGIDEELLKIRVYPINQEIELDKPRAYASTIKKRYADFSSTLENQAGTVFSYGIDTESYGVITGSDDDNSLDMSSTTFECEVYFPKKHSFDSRASTFSSAQTASIAGVSSIHDDSENPIYGETNDTTQDLNETGNYKIRFIKDSPESTSGYFSLLFPFGTMGEIRSPTFEVYDNQRWNLSVRIGEKTKYGDFLDGSVQDYQVSFSGYNYESTTKASSFEVKSEIPLAEAVQILTVSRRVFAGADVNNHTGSVATTRSDVLISSVRYWLDWLPEEVLENHARYPNSFGTEAIDNSYYYDSGLTGDYISGKQISKMDLLVLNWDFSKIEYRELPADVLIPDRTGYYSYDRSNSEPTGVDIIDYKTAKNYSARFHFPEGGDTSVKSITKVKQILGARESEVDYIRDSELINIKEGDHDPFKVNPDPVYNKVTVEKSYSAVINDEIIKYFTAMSYFSNLIGRPVNRYRINYKEIDFFKRKIFSLFNPESDPNKDPDIEKFLEYYKWIDDSIGTFLKQLLPASSMDNQNALSIIESHLLERSKYQHKLGLFSVEADSQDYEPLNRLGQRKPVELVGSARFNFPRTPIDNLKSQRMPQVEYVEILDSFGNKKLYITTDDIVYFKANPEGNFIEQENKTVADFIADFRNGHSLQIDFA